MAELLISSRRTSEDDLRSLMDRLSVAIPDAEPVKDRDRVFMITLSTSASAYETGPPEDPPSEGVPVDVGILLSGPDVVELVLPAVAGVTVKAAVEVTVNWLRGLRQKPTEGEKAVLIYGPRGEPLSKIRLRAGLAAPEVSRHPGRGKAQGHRWSAHRTSTWPPAGATGVASSIESLLSRSGEVSYALETCVSTPSSAPRLRGRRVLPRASGRLGPRASYL